MGMMQSQGMSPWSRSSSYLPAMGGGGGAGGYGYTPSLAPSERSNVGLASRYRPVSNHPDDFDAGMQQRSSTFSSAMAAPWADYQQPGGRRSPTGATIRTVNPRSRSAGVDDEDDEEGWAEMKAQRDKKKKGWATRKRTEQKDARSPGRL